MNDFLDVFTRLQRYISAKLLHVRANYSYNIGAVTNRIIFRKNRGIFFQTELDDLIHKTSAKL